MTKIELLLTAVDFQSWDTYLKGGIAALLAYVLKNQVTQGKDVTQMQTVIKYYVERQTEDAARRLDVNNPVPENIQVLVKKHIRKMPLTEAEHLELTGWLKWTGTGKNPEADLAERSASLQLLTGIRTSEMFPRKRRWWQLI